MNWQKFHKRIQGLKGWRGGAFILALAERAVPNAQLYFSAQESAAGTWPSPEDLAARVDSVWQHLIAKPNEEELILLLDQVTDWIPDTDEDAPYGAFPTADCLELMEQALLSGINQEQARAVAASQRSMATITQFLEVSEGDGLSEDELIKLFDRHPLMQREYSFQEELCDLLRTANSPADKLLTELRTLARDEGVSNIGISLDTD